MMTQQKNQCHINVNVKLYPSESIKPQATFCNSQFNLITSSHRAVGCHLPRDGATSRLPCTSETGGSATASSPRLCYMSKQWDLPAGFLGWVFLVLVAFFHHLLFVSTCTWWATVLNVKCDHKACIYQTQEEARRHEGSHISANLIKNIHPTLPSLPPRAAVAHSTAGAMGTEELLAEYPMLPSPRQSLRPPTPSHHGRHKYVAEGDPTRAVSETACQSKCCFRHPPNHSTTAKCCQNKWKISKVLQRVKKLKKKNLMGEKLSNGHLIP